MADASPNPSDDRRPPSYDTSIKGYTGISAGALEGIEGLRDSRAFAEMIVDTIREGLLVLDFDLRVVVANESFYQTFGVEPEETVGQLIYDLGNGQWDIPKLRELLESILPHEKAFDDYEVDHKFEGIGRCVVILNARRLDDHHLILLAIEDVTERRRGERELRMLARTLEARVEGRTAQVRKLSRALTMAEQEERRRLAHVLHDDLQQVLYGAQIQVELGNMEGVAAILEDAVRTVRSLSHELAPPIFRGRGLHELFGWLAGKKQALYGLRVDHDAGDLEVSDEEVRTLLYHLLRELLFNVAKHSGTDLVRMWAEPCEGGVRVMVEDDGAGFDPSTLAGEEERVGLGLLSVRERLEAVGGRLEVASAPGEGTRVVIEVPSGLDGGRGRG